MIKEKERRIYQSCELVVFKKGFLTQCGNNGNYERKRLQPAQSILKAPLTAPKADNHEGITMLADETVRKTRRSKRKAIC